VRPMPRHLCVVSPRVLLAKVRKDLIVLGEPARLVLGEDEVSVHDDIEDSPAALDQLRLDIELFGDSGRQTGGLREVVSGYAVGNRYVHLLDSSFIKQ
jgi:hypothetical protein